MCEIMCLATLAAARQSGYAVGGTMYVLLPYKELCVSSEQARQLALVTGASRGIGASVALLLCNEAQPRRSDARHRCAPPPDTGRRPDRLLSPATGLTSTARSRSSLPTRRSPSASAPARTLCAPLPARPSEEAQQRAGFALCIVHSYPDTSRDVEGHPSAPLSP
jgi:hypothetical protein